MANQINSKIISNGSSTKFPIIGIGASAGGLEALELFLKNVPENNLMSFVIVQHLDPTQKDFMVELLSRVTKMKVFQIKDGMHIIPNSVYVIPPNKNLSILHGDLFLMDTTTPRGHRMPIDFFLHSLADDRQEESIAVILSGMGTDGTLGLKTIKEKGGFSFVQDPDTAKFNSMPSSAIKEGLADIIAPVEEIPAQIVAYINHKPLIAMENEQIKIKNQSSIEKIFILLRRQTGQDYSLYKQSTIYRRIERRMGIHQIVDITIYVKFLQENPQELNLLFNELLIGITSFFRDPSAWEALKNEITELLRSKAPDYHFRAWVAGCSTGEEAYSLAILFKEAQEQVENAHSATLSIFATDIDIDAINKGRNGTYLANIVSDVSEDRLRKYFVKVGDKFKISKSIREMVIFAPHNVIMDPPYSHIDILTCRNLLIYMTPQLQKKILPFFHYSINVDGILLLGSAESIGNFTNLFKSLNAKTQLYIRSEVGVSTYPIEFPSSPTIASNPLLQEMKPLENLAMLAEKKILQQYTPAAILTNERGDIIYISSKTGKYLEPSVGKAYMNIFAMAREGLRYPLTEAFNKALIQKSIINIKNINIKSESGIQTIDLTIEPINEPRSLRGNVMIVMQDVISFSEKTITKSNKKEVPNSNYLIKLEQELQHANQENIATKEEMQSAQEELQSTNEELQSMNEEMQSANEELTTAKEEMQSINEELQTVNHELISKVDELSFVNDDIKNLLNSTEIGTVFLNNELRIKRFTDQMSTSSNLIQIDIGRRITDIASELFYPDLAKDAKEVLRTLRPKEKNITYLNGQKYFCVRIMPYRMADNRIDGLTITFIDISVSKKLEIELQENKERFNLAVKNTFITFSNQDRQLRYTWIHNPTLGFGLVLILNKTDEELFGVKESTEISELKKAVLLNGKPIRKIIQLKQNLNKFIYDITINPITDTEGTVLGVSTALVNITETSGMFMPELLKKE